ncbi:DEAD/DEAH box helicase family protein [Thiocystis violascens]|uniref:Type III restriction enzyme, res subunit n=1 Tax=Thiocystis violascens (strain ATCC 17096 / DSM 198 / 6111) TaxID=765911 RepID=I3YDF6_THIV6|nr:DEAD/DEAH box helicase family protein [Thiocystis violascens]AFL75024.1 Type III restriction enzyme, res subunit [Thiocystis violascens DSM 198]
MNLFHELIAARVDAWRAEGYPCADYPAIAEILGHAIDDERTGHLRYLRKAQFRALEVYWFLRLVEGTPKIPDLYARCFPKKAERREALGLSAKAFEDADYDFDVLFARIRTDNAFVRANHLESLRETLTLDYPSYILALAMGAGKTILIGAIVATEFAMAQEYPDGPFVQNALIFAPGKTIIESLREISDIPFGKLLPPRFEKLFAASLKLTFTRDGDKELSGVIDGSAYNLIVTNTEKIRIQKPAVRGNGQQFRLFANTKAEEAEEIANLRLQKIASLPHLAVFSDEAHHTYGQKLLGKWEKDPDSGEPVFKEQGIKKVRRTVDYLAQETNLVVVVNTTGTPYFERQPLRDVVVWYGLGEGIQDGVLKDVAGNIKVFSLDDEHGSLLVSKIVTDFVDTYWETRLPDGSPARLALYFPTVAARDELRTAIESTLAQRAIAPAVLLAVDAKSAETVKAEFYRLAHDPSAQHRIVLLVNMGTEGWNCPSLFACGLVRRLTGSNNFVLQAATRCLRQVPGNATPARIYVSRENESILERQLVETYGTTLNDLNATQAERLEKDIRLHKPDLPPLSIKKRVLRFRRRADPSGVSPLAFQRPEIDAPLAGRLDTWSIVEVGGRGQLTRIDTEALHAEPDTLDLYSAAGGLAANYHLPMSELLAALRALYGAGATIPVHHLDALSQQIETQRREYEEDWQEVEIALALVKPDGFQRHTDADGTPFYTARISFEKSREHLYRMADSFPNQGFARDKSFHYEGYNFDSEPEAAYLEQALNVIAQYAENVEGVWFTGGLTDPSKTDLYAEYLGEDGRWHRYTPDFVILRKDGKCLVVEVKSEQHRADIAADLARADTGQQPRSREGRKAVAMRQLTDIDPERLTYRVIFAGNVLPAEALEETRRFVAQD